MQAAIRELMDEHQIILRMLGALRGMCARSGEAGTAPVADLEAAGDFVRSFADYTHHGKEEDLLFPAMEEAGVPRDGGPIAVMLMEHEMGRGYARAFSDAVARLKAGEKLAAGEAAQQAENYAGLLQAHIYKEDNILYPMAMENISESRFQRLAQDFARVEEERMGPAKRAGYIELVERLARAYPAPAGGGRPRGRRGG